MRSDYITEILGDNRVQRGNIQRDNTWESLRTFKSHKCLDLRNKIHIIHITETTEIYSRRS